VLVQKRATIKSQLTRFRGYLKKCSERPDEQQLIERLEKIRSTWDSFDQVQSNLELLNINEGEHGVESNDERAQFEEAFFELTACAQRLLASLRIPAANDNLETVQNQPVVQSVKTNIKLPTINLPTLDGKYEAWLTFYDNFTSIVHDNVNLTPVQKLQYLRSSLTDEAAQMISKKSLSCIRECNSR